MPVFDFNQTSEEKKQSVKTYVTFQSNNDFASAESPIMLIDNSLGEHKHHSTGIFTNPIKRTSFEFDTEDKNSLEADILKIDSRFVSLIKWLGENHIRVKLSG